MSSNDFTDEYKKQLDDGINIDVDTELSKTSENPVQNKIITSALSYKIKRINYHVPLGIWQQEPGMFDFCMTRLPDGRIGFEQQDSMIVFYISQGNLVKGTKNTLILTQSTMNENTVGVQTIFDSNTNLLWQRMNLDSTKEWTEWEVISVSQTDLYKKVDKEDGKGLSTNDFTDELKNKLDGIEPNATALPKVINIYCENQLDERIAKWDNKSLFNEYTDDGLYYFSFKYFYAYNINDEYSDGYEISDDALLLVNTREDGGPQVYQTLITYGKIYTNFLIDGNENVPSNWELMTVSQKALDNAIGDVETSLENIIAKYGLGGDGV